MAFQLSFHNKVNMYLIAIKKVSHEKEKSMYFRSIVIASLLRKKKKFHNPCVIGMAFAFPSVVLKLHNKPLTRPHLAP
jgi:hypothetical protein